MCMFCGNTNPVLKIEITDKYGTIEYCPNCLCLYAYNNGIDFVESPFFKDDITNTYGAICYHSFDETYFLSLETLKRLVCHNLTKEEYRILVNKYGEHKFMLHDDFYLEDGTPIQPMGV